MFSKYHSCSMCHIIWACSWFWKSDVHAWILFESQISVEVCMDFKLFVLEVCENMSLWNVILWCVSGVSNSIWFSRNVICLLCVNIYFIFQGVCLQWWSKNWCVFAGNCFLVFFNTAYSISMQWLFFRGWGIIVFSWFFLIVHT